MARSDKFYAAIPVQDELGKGFSLFSHEDDVYAARVTDGSDSRLYMSGGGWRAKIRFPVADDIEAHESYKELAELIEEQYDLNLSMTAHEFNNALESDEEQARRKRGGIEICYTPGDESVPGEDTAFVNAYLGTLGSYMAGGTAAGGAYGGMTGGPEGALAGAGIGLVGGFATAAGDLFTAITTEQVYKPLTPGAAVGRLNERKHRKRYRAGRYFPPKKYLDDLNRLHRLDRVIEETDQLMVKEEFNDLQSTKVDETFETELNELFDDFEEMNGLHVCGRFPEYGDAVSFIALLQEDDEVELERPTIYREPEIFQKLFENTIYEHDGEERILPEGRSIVHNVFERDADPAIDTFLQSNYQQIYNAEGVNL